MNALSYSEKGKEVINNALDYRENGVFINLKGFHSIYVKNEEIEKAKQEGKYSSGDDDMIIFELAIKQVMEEIKSGKAIYDPDTPVNIISLLNNMATKDSLDIEGGFSGVIMYLITGQTPEDNGGQIFSNGNEDELLDNFEKTEIKIYR